MSDKDQANIKNLHGGGELRETGSKKNISGLQVHLCPTSSRRVTV